MLAGAYRVKDWHQIRQALPGAGAGAELVVLVVRPGAGAELVVLVVLVVRPGAGAELAMLTGAQQQKPAQAAITVPD